MKRSEAIKLRALIEQAVVALPDKEASEGAMLFPKLKQDGNLVKAGTRINWGGTIKRAAVDIWDTEDNDPNHAPTLWEDIAYKQGFRVLTGQITASNPVQVDEICWYQDCLYKNILGVASAYLPDEYPQGWEKVEP